MWVRLRTSGTVTHTVNDAARTWPCGLLCVDFAPTFGEGQVGGAGIPNTPWLRAAISAGTGGNYWEPLPRILGGTQLEWITKVQAGWELRGMREGIPGGPSCSTCEPPFPQIGWYLLSGGTTFHVEEVIPLQAAPRQTQVARGDSAVFDAVALDGVTDFRWYFVDVNGGAEEVRRCQGQTSCSHAARADGRMYVYGQWYGRMTFEARSDAIRLVDAKLTLTCDQYRLERGATLSCAATATPAGTLDSIQWRFVDIAGHVIDSAGPPSWSGRMIVGGTISVRAVLNGSPVADDTIITVRPRRWPRPSVVAHEEPRHPSTISGERYPSRASRG